MPHMARERYTFLQRHLPLLASMRRAREEVYSLAREHTSEPLVRGFAPLSREEIILSHTPLVFLLRKFRRDEHYSWGVGMERTSVQRARRDFPDINW